jgi:uncharacterized membrane protein
VSGDPLRHRKQHVTDESTFGHSRFGILAERFARFFGTPKFIIGQTCVVAVWIALNGLAFIHHWDPYPFILLNLLFSTQAAYAAPLILLAQTRQADRDKASAEADAHHREEVANRQSGLIEANTALTELVKGDTDRLDEIHRHVTAIGQHLGIPDTVDPSSPDPAGA